MSQHLVFPCFDEVPRASAESLSVAGLFAGIGGIELGLHEAGHRSRYLCEVDDAAQRVLRARFPECELKGDICDLKRLPRVDLVAAGFPCQDLSQAGRTQGIRGQRSGLVERVFPLLGKKGRGPQWLLIENVPFMLQLDRGGAMRFLVETLESMGFAWAYRVVDARSFGLPQRRRRVILLASRTEDPRPVLFGEDVGVPREFDADAEACGFYWTEGNRGLGWAVDAIPTLKGGSTIGIPSPPAIWLRSESRLVTPDVRDAERLQGFPADWTLPAVASGTRQGVRWRLVGNAVSVPVSRWVGTRLSCRVESASHSSEPLTNGQSWPTAAWGRLGVRFRAEVSEWPVHEPYRRLADFLEFPPQPLSERATVGFYRRFERSSLRKPDGFLEAVEAHLESMRETPAR